MLGVTEASTMQLLPACIHWKDTEWWSIFQSVHATQHSQGWRHARPGPHLRWDRAFAVTLGVTWKHMASNAVEWQRRKGEFIAKAYRYLNLRELEDRFRPSHRESKTMKMPPVKKQRVYEELKLEWAALPDHKAIRICIKGDSKVVIRRLQGRWAVKYAEYSKVVEKCLASLDHMLGSALLLPSVDAGELFYHIYREENAEADALAAETHIEQLSSVGYVQILRFIYLKALSKAT